MIGVENKQLTVGRRPDLVRQNPLVFLMASGLLPGLAESHPLIKTDRKGNFLKVEKISLGNFYEKSVAYQSWIEGAAPALQKYMNFEVANMWRAFNNQELTREYPLDEVLQQKGFLKRSVDGHEYRTAQMTPVVEIGSGWKMVDLMVVPTGGKDMSKSRIPEYVRGYSPLVFYHPEMDRKGWDLLRNLTDDFAKGLFSLGRNTTVNMSSQRGEVRVVNGDQGRDMLRTKSLFEIVGGSYGSAGMLENDWESELAGANVKTNAGLACELLNRARKEFVPIVDSVALTAKRIAENFSEDYARMNPKIGNGNVETFSQIIMASWPGAMGQYFEKYFNRPTADFVAGRRVSL